jgi:hypothetical protein
MENMSDDRACALCNGQLPTGSARQRRYCSTVCKKRAAAKCPAVCASCGARFRLASDRLKRSPERVFCSRACQGRHAKDTGIRRGPQNARWKHGRSTIRDSTYGIWKAMIKRCTNPSTVGYKYYGGRGITVCERWVNSFESFLSDMGERPAGTSIDRRDNSGDYEPGNCRWATALEQVRNSRRYKLRLHHRTKIVWLRECGLLQREIGELLGFSQSAVSKAILEYKEMA